MAKPFTSPKVAALALLNSEAKLNRKAGAFLGQAVADWSYRQRQREACDRARLLIAMRELCHAAH